MPASPSPRRTAAALFASIGPDCSRRVWLSAAAGVWGAAWLAGIEGFPSLAAHAADAAPAPATRVGFAERDISPEIGMECPGGYGKSYHRVFHDPCKARVAVFDDGPTKVALVGLDALGVHRPMVERVRAEITRRTGIPGECVLINASHSHSSGPLYGVLPGEYDDAPAELQQLAYEKSTCVDAKYLERVERAVVDAVVEAHDRRAELQTGVGRGKEDRAAYNRRFRMRSGLTATHPGQLNPDILEVAGPTDPEVGVIGGWTAEGKLVGCIVTYCCHATTSPGGISANYIYYLEQAIRGMFGPEVVVVFLSAPAGDVTQVDNLSPFVNRGPEEWARYVGGRVGAEAVKVLLEMPRGTLAPLAAKTEVLRIPRRPPRPERVARCRELVAQDPAKVGVTEWTFAKEIVLLDYKLRREPEVDVEVQALQVGPVVFLATPAEYFCEFGLQMKERCAFPFTFPVALSNGGVGYVPTLEAFSPRGGGYETRLTSYSNLVPTAGDTMRDALLKLAATLRPGPVPERPRVPPRKQVWTYGEVPPELD